MMIHHYEAPRGPERVPFRVVMALFAMGVMTLFQALVFCRGGLFARAPMAFFQDETHKMGIVAAQGEPQKQLNADPQLTGRRRRSSIKRRRG